MMLQLAFHGFMNGSNMAISGFRDFLFTFLWFHEGRKDDGKKRMMRTWEHILNGLCEVLKNDPEIRPGVFDENFTEMQFAEILFSLIFGISDPRGL